MQPLLPTFEPSDNDLIEMALALPLDKKIEKAIEILRQYESLALKHNVMGYNLRFSSGKDSCVIDWLAKKAGIKHYKTYSNTTIDPPELVKFLKKHHPDAVWINSDHGHLILDRAVKKRNMPTRRGKWCCDEYKNCCSNTKCETSVKIIGVRISESAKRAGAWKTLTHTERGDIVVGPMMIYGGVSMRIISPTANYTTKDGRALVVLAARLIQRHKRRSLSAGRSTRRCGKPLAVKFGKFHRQKRTRGDKTAIGRNFVDGRICGTGGLPAKFLSTCARTRQRLWS